MPWPAWHAAVAKRFCRRAGEAAAAVLPARANFLADGFSPAAGRTRWPSSRAAARGHHGRRAGAPARPCASSAASESACSAMRAGRRRPGQPGSTARLGRRANGRFPASWRRPAILAWTGSAVPTMPFCRTAPTAVPGGTWQGGVHGPFDPLAIAEDTGRAWLAEAPLRHPGGETIVDADKAEAYTWCKAPRYAARPRGLAPGRQSLPATASRHGYRKRRQRHGSVVARLLELALVVRPWRLGARAAARRSLLRLRRDAR